ncbi:MAG: amidase [Alphaproteobacteria bacterium]|nr:amidase [Alphaproteobacteria bacterium]
MPYSRRTVLTGAGAAGITIAANAGLTQSGGSLAYHNVRELAAALAAREISARELTDFCIARIEALDGKLNAVVVRDFENARTAAREADAALARGERKPLLGIPMTVKESYNVAGLPTTWGIPGAKGRLAGDDAATVERLKAAGAIILGKTNVPFMLADWQCYNAVYGTTNNPWDVARTPGGSSGGAAAALAAGFVPLELGSDIGGSLRAPAHFCGVFAHKPTHGLIPNRGQVPPGAPSLPTEIDLAVAGPMARSAGDLALALDVLAGPDAPLAIAYKLSLPAPRHDKLAGYRVLVLDAHPLLPTSNVVRAAIEALAANLEKVGATVARKSPLLPDLDSMARTYYQLLNSIFGADVPIEVYERVRSAASGPASDASFEAVGTRGFVLSHRDWIWADRARKVMAQRWRALFREFDVVVCPILPTVAFAHDHSEPLRSRQLDVDGAPQVYGRQAVWAGLATLTGQPATAVPIARSPEGLPIGVQIIGPYLEDRTTIAFAELIEHAFGAFVPPPSYAG